jgi:hypothetical protein
VKIRIVHLLLKGISKFIVFNSKTKYFEFMKKWDYSPIAVFEVLEGDVNSDNMVKVESEMWKSWR